MLPEKDLVIIFLLAGSAFVLLLVVFVLIYVFLYQKRVNEYNQKLQEQELKKQQELFLALHEGEEKERRRLAEELHDGIGAKLSGLKMSVEYLQGQHLHAQEKQVFENLKMGLHDTIDELRSISQNLQPAFINNRGLKNALADLTETMNTQNGCRYTGFVQLDEETLDPKFRLILFRMISELLTNIHKHAGATQASVQVLQADDTIQLIAEDNGQGFQQTATKGIGLMNLHNRVELCKGKLSVDSSPAGTTVIIDLPVMKNI